MSATTPRPRARMHEADESAADAPTPPPRSTCCSATPPAARSAGSCPACRGSGSPPAWPATPAGCRRPHRDLVGELAKVGAGRSDARAAREGPPVHRGGLDQEPVLLRTLQAYLAVGETARGLVKDADLDWGDDQRMGFIVDNLVEASAPSNNPFLNPKVLKRIVDTGGGNLVEGSRRFVRDFATAPRVPSMVEPDAFEVGHRHRGHPGGGGAAHRHVRADPVHPADAQGAHGPAADRAADDQQVLRDRPRRAAQPGRAPGRQRASRSTASPGATPTPGTPTGAWTATARRSSRRWTPPRRSPGSDQVALLGICSGGMLSSMVLGHLAAIGDARPGGGVQPRGDGARPGAGRPAERAAVPQGGGGLDAGVARRRATSTAGCSPRCSPGCGPTT